MKYKYTCNAVRWFDKVNGNTYHSVNITRHRDGKMLYCQFQYGYDEHYRQTALEEMAASKWLPVKYRGENENGSSKSYMYERENNYPIFWNVSDGLKRDCIKNGQRP